jgi:hypothetical protein
MSRCTACDGSGTIKEYDDYDRYYLHPCSVCNGTGEIGNKSQLTEVWLDEITEWTEEMFATIRRKLNMVPYTVRLNKSTGMFEVGTAYNGAWNVVAAFIYERNAKHWAEVMNGSRSIVPNPVMLIDAVTRNNPKLAAMLHSSWPDRRATTNQMAEDLSTLSYLMVESINKTGALDDTTSAIAHRFFDLNILQIIDLLNDKLFDYDEP